MGDLANRMKAYEAVTTSVRLIPKLPVLLRLDGRAFHTLTRDMRRPYDEQFMACMWQAALALCQEVQNAKLAYVQSDEISLLLVDYESRETQPWFGYDLQKVCSISAALASVAFGALFRHYFPQADDLPVFDSRAWNLPPHEVVNYFIWRQQDATRNSISMAAQEYYTSRELHGVTSDGLQELLFQKGINWNDYPAAFKRGVCFRRVPVEFVAPAEGGELVTVTRLKWRMDVETPIFAQDRQYVEQHAFPQEEA